jgi:hypothetical protein
MHLLYIDDSGSVVDKKCGHCVLAGFSVYETRTYWLEKAVNDIITAYLPAYPDVELHGTAIRSGSREWRGIPHDIREAILVDILNLMNKSYPQVILFGSIIAKTVFSPKDDITEDLFTQVATRFDKYLGRINSKNQKAHERGIAIFDKSSAEIEIQKLSRAFTNTGHRLGGRFHYFAEVPLFLDSKMSRLIQLADVIAYSLFRKYEYNDDSYFSIIANCFDKSDGMVHGLHTFVE